METAYDIIFFWVARMMMLGIHLIGDAPFDVVYLSGLVRDPYGQKMSKTKGNVVDPLEAIDESGADALRFALIHGAAPGNDQKFSAEKLEHARNFANKLWNAARFVLGARPATIPADAARVAPDPARLGPGRALAAEPGGGDGRRRPTGPSPTIAFGQLTGTLYDAIWGEYCDWALELAKVRLADETLPAADREATWWTLVEALDTYLRLLHPVMPFVTEAIWGQLPKAADDPRAARRRRLARGRPHRRRGRGRDRRAPRPRPGDPQRPQRGEGRPHRLAAGRRRRAAGLAPAFDALRPALERLARARPLRRVDRRAPSTTTRPAAWRSSPASSRRSSFPAERRRRDAATAARDRARLEKELADAEGLLASARARLADERFTAKAPAPSSTAPGPARPSWPSGWRSCAARLGMTG